jgi:serine/threonine-protein kinase
VAAKAIRPDAARGVTPEALDGLRAATTLAHPHIATLHDVLQDQEESRQRIFAVYEYVAGLSLETMLRRLALPEKPILLRCLEQVADALDYADTRGLVHRDIRPSNILITTSEPVVAKVTDFGISQIAPHEMTSGGAMLGTPFYLSPEEIQGTAVDGRSDQFSLAVVTYEVLTGTKPFAADNLPGIFFQICRQGAKPAHVVNGSLTPEVSAVLERALAKTPAQRFLCCADFVGTLAQALKEIPEWAAEGAFVRAAAPAVTAAWADVTAARPSTIPVQEMRRLPSLPRRGFDEDEDEFDKPKKHSPWMLLGLMLALSAVVILLSFLWRQWDWKPAIPGFKSHAANTAKQQGTERAKTVTPPAQVPPPAATPQQQTGTTPAPSVPAASPPTTNNPSVNATAQAENKPVQTQSPAATHRVAKQVLSGPVPGATASIDLLSVPPGATMMIDNNSQLSCVTPCTMSLPNGRHTAAALLNGYNVSRKVFNVPDDTSVVAALNQSSGTLVLTSTPPGAKIFVDNKPDGVTPTTLHLPAGSHKLVLTQGAMQHEETIEIEGGELQSRSLRW